MQANHTHRLGAAVRVPLAVAILAAAVVAGNAAAAENPLNLDRGMVAALQRDLGMSPADYARYLRVERQHDLVTATAQRQLGNAFGGSWIEQGRDGEHRVVIATTRSPKALNIPGVEIRQVRHSLRELEAAAAALDEAADRRDASVAGLQSWGVDPRTNSVVVTLSPNAAMRTADFVASSHYARITTEPDGCLALRRGIDHTKDQSYVLFGVPRAHLADMLLPIGGLEKPRVRELAHELSLPVFDKPDSQEICFVPDNDYAGLVERRRPDLARKGRILDTQGNTVGEHDGQHRYTIGQRRGVGVALGYPIYVVDKDPDANTVTIGNPEDLLTSSCTVSEANWLIDESRFAEWTPTLARYRYNASPQPAEARLLPDTTDATPSGRAGRFAVRFPEPQRAVAPGQALVLYDASDSDRVLAGGWIESVE